MVQARRVLMAAMIVHLVLSAAPILSAAEKRTVIVPEGAARLVRPILDAQRESSTQNAGADSVSEMLYAVIKNKTRAADEALVVLTCFYIGESQEEADEIIARGRRMLPLIQKYRNGVPSVPKRVYPKSMLRGDKQEHLDGLVRAIRKGWRGTWDNPDG